MKPDELPQVEGEVVERIDKSQLKPMYETDHEHQYMRDPDDETNGYYAEMCVVKNCNLGRLVAKV